MKILLSLLMLFTGLQTQEPTSLVEPTNYNEQDICNDPNCTLLQEPEIDCGVNEPPPGYAWMKNQTCINTCFIAYRDKMIDLKERSCDQINNAFGDWYYARKALIEQYRACKSTASTPEQLVECRMTFFTSSISIKDIYERRKQRIVDDFNQRAGVERELFKACGLNCCYLVQL